MKKNIIALAVASAIAAPLAVQADPTVYGIANMAINNNAKGDSTGTTTDSVASRLGVKGSEDLGNGLKAVYKMEFGIDMSADGKGTSDLTNRNQYVGLAGGFGTVLMGRHDTPTKMSQPKDLFNDGLGDNGSSTGIGNKGGEQRLGDVLAYVSPSFGGIKIVAAAVSGDTDKDGDKESGFAESYSIAAMYGSTKEGIYAAVAMDSVGEALAGTGKDYTYTRASVQYAANGLVANAMYQMYSNDNADNNNITISAGYKMGAMMPKIKYSMDGGDADGTYTGIGLNYSLGKKTTAYVELNMFNDDLATAAATAAAGTYTAAKGYTATSIGLQHKF